MDPSTKSAASAPSVSQPDSNDSISKGFGANPHNDDGTPSHQDGVEPAVPSAHTHRYPTKEQRSAVLQELIKRYVGVRVGWGVFQDIMD